MLKKILIGFVCIIVLLLLVLVVTYYISGPRQPDDASSSAKWLQPGDYSVAMVDLVLEDTARATAENRGVPGSASRVLNTSVWYPQASSGDAKPLPIVVFSHGFTANRKDAAYLAEYWASHGYVVVAADYPLTHGAAPGGPRVEDVVNQPGDISFILDELTSGQVAELAHLTLDPTKIALAGHSLGGLTTLLASYHPRLRDPRIDVAIAMAAPSNMFNQRFFAHANVALLGIAGTDDALIEYDSNASDLPQRVPGAGLVTIQSGTHLGFNGISEPALRFMHNPDVLGCQAVLGNLEDSNTNSISSVLGTIAEGIDVPPNAPPICGQEELNKALHPGRQQMIIKTASLAFLNSHFAPHQTQREMARRYLSAELAQDFSEASFSK